MCYGNKDMQLENSASCCELNAQRGLFSFHPEDKLFPFIENAYLSITYVINNQPYSHRIVNWSHQQNHPTTINIGHEGGIKTVDFIGEIKDCQLSFHLTFALLKASPMLCWKLEVKNQSEQPIYIQKIEMLHLDESGEDCARIKLAGKLSQTAFFSHGWQSWSHSAAYRATEAPHRSMLVPFQLPQVVNSGTPYTRQSGHHSSDFFAVLADCKNRTGLLAGFLSQKMHFGSVEMNFTEKPALYLWVNGDHARLDPGCMIETDWAVLAPISIDEPDPLAFYLDVVAREHQVREFGRLPVGWCSWYQFYTKVTEEQLESNFQAMIDLRGKLPLKLFQIDDGYQSQVGDWLTFKSTFPKGVNNFVSQCKKDGIVPGIWLAPFIIHRGSNLYKQHPDWILRSRQGHPVNAGFGWNSFTTALDLTHPDALEYATHVVDVATHQWGFPYLKFDFLYAAAVRGKYKDERKTRAQVLRCGLERIREAAGEETFLLGCGVPMGSAIGIFNSVRIGPDVLESWKPKWFGISTIFRNEPNMPAARNSIQNILTRAPLHRRWWINDPDCLLVRPNMDLTLAEVQSLATTIAMTGGSLLLSDDLSSLPEERIRLAACLLPPMDRRPWIIDWMDANTPSCLRLDLHNTSGEWRLLAQFNWLDVPIEVSILPSDFHLPDDAYWSCSFWDEEISYHPKGRPLLHQLIPPHAVVLLSVRQPSNTSPQYLGSDLHISQGLEIDRWESSSRMVNGNFSLGRAAKGRFSIIIPDHITHVTEVEGCTWAGRDKQYPAIHHFQVEVDGERDFRICW
jgi:alpha-galactosidase